MKLTQKISIYHPKYKLEASIIIKWTNFDGLTDGVWCPLHSGRLVQNK